MTTEGNPNTQVGGGDKKHEKAHVIKNHRNTEYYKASDGANQHIIRLE